MKKIMLVLLVTLLGFGWLSAQTFTFTAPKTGESWALGGSKVITWTYSGFPNGTAVKLILYQGGTMIGSLVTSTAIGANGSGSWTWTKVGEYAGGKAKEGGDYKIRIRDTQNKYPYAVSGLFTLSKGTGDYIIISANEIAKNFQLVNSINVSMPAQGLQVKPGDMLEIKWDRAPIATYPQVKFGVYLPDRKTYIGLVHKTDAGLKPNTGDYQDAYVFNARYEVGKEYVIRVATPDDKFIGFSGVFRVKPLEPVQVTETFTGSASAHYPKIVQWESPIIGCFYKLGEAPTWPSSGYAVGFTNTMEDPAGPCWKYIGHVYRTIVKPSGIYKGFVVTKAVLRFGVLSYAKKQTFFVLRCDAAGDTLSVPTTTLATIDNWVFSQTIEVDITATVQAWCTGQAPNHGLIIRGGDESFAHNNTNAQCAISAPELVITRTEYK
jgi:hypothetical protein